MPATTTATRRLMELLPWCGRFILTLLSPGCREPTPYGARRWRVRWWATRGDKLSGLHAMQFPCGDSRLVPGRTAVPSKLSSGKVAAQRWPPRRSLPCWRSAGCRRRQPVRRLSLACWGMGVRGSGWPPRRSPPGRHQPRTRRPPPWSRTRVLEEATCHRSPPSSAQPGSHPCRWCWIRDPAGPDRVSDVAGGGHGCTVAAAGDPRGQRGG